MYLNVTAGLFHREYALVFIWTLLANLDVVIGVGCGMSKYNCVVSNLLCWRRHVSATAGHLHVTKMYTEENNTEYDQSIGAYCKLSKGSHFRLDYTYSAKSTSSK